MRNYAILFFFISTINLSAQERSFYCGFSAGYDFYSQNELKSLNQGIIQQKPFHVNIIDDFKPRLNYNFYAQFMFSKKLFLGPEYAYHFSGSRLGVKDYSGFFSFDQYLRTHQFGIKFNYYFVTMSRSSIVLEMNTGAGSTHWKTESQTKIGDNGEYSEDKTNEYTGFSWYMAPATKYQFNLGPQLHINWTVSYSFDLRKKYYITDNSVTHAINLTPSWSGLNLLMGVGYIFQFQSRNKSH